MSKTITGSVGRGGRNFPPSDVMTVQYLLNCVPVSQGGPMPELAVDGAVGPKTMTAIETFQRANGGFADGRVDPGGATLRALQARDPLPNQPLPQSDAKNAGWQGGQGAAAKTGTFGNAFGSPQPGKSPGAPGFPGKSVPGMPPSKTGGGMAQPGFGQPGVKGGNVDGMGSKGGGTKNF
jgi:peptidoglycan hydrolase-like protein with peptidoglycan-binding domain